MINIIKELWIHFLISIKKHSLLSNIIRRLGVSSSLCFRGQERTRGAGSDQTRPHRQGRGVAARLWLRLRLGRSRERARGRPPEHVPAMARSQKLGINGLHREKLWFWPSHQQIISTHFVGLLFFFFLTQQCLFKCMQITVWGLTWSGVSKLVSHSFNHTFIQLPSWTPGRLHTYEYPDEVLRTAYCVHVCTLKLRQYF